MIFYGDNIEIWSVGSSKIFQTENVVETEVDICEQFVGFILSVTWFLCPH